MSTPTIVVTGATGFLGGHILSALQGEPATVIAAVRDASRLPDWFTGDTLVGDLTDPAYRRQVAAAGDVIIHAGTWSSFWGHAREERTKFLEPALDLLELAAAAGAKRFIAASTVALGTPARGDALVAEDEPLVARRFWPHHAAMVEVERRMQELAASTDTQMVSLRLGHFIGRGNSLGIVSAIIPRLKTRQVPWVNHGRAHLPLVSGADMGRAFALAALAPTDALNDYEAIHVVGTEQPTAREVFTHVAATAGVPTPAYSVPVGAAYGFGALMEALHPVLPGRAPFLTRSLVFVGENWHVSDAAARDKLGFVATDDWRDVVADTVEERRAGGFAWPELAQA